MTRKNVSAIVSGAGWIGSFASELIKALRKRGVSDEDIHSLVTEEGKLPVSKIADVLAEIVRAKKDQILIAADVAGGWIEEMVAREKEYHRNALGQEIFSGIDYTPFFNFLEQSGLEKVNQWQQDFRRIVFLPPIKMTRDLELSDAWVKPRDWFYEQERQGKLMRFKPDGSVVKDENVLWLGNPETGGTIALVDARKKPNYNDSKQMWDEDIFLGGIIEKLRKDRKIQKYEYGPQSSRFGVSSQEVEQCVWSAYAKALGLEPCQVVSESMVRFNFISQAYPDMPRFHDGQTNTWIWLAEIWLAELFGDDSWRLHGGDSQYGGMASVHYRDADSHWYHVGVRPLAVLLGPWALEV